MNNYMWLLCVGLVGCASHGRGALGSLEVGLTSQAGGATYRLSEARLRLEGPQVRDISTNGEDSLSLMLPGGTYKLRLFEGYKLVRADGDTDVPVQATLASENPSTVVVVPGSLTTATLRFELGDGAFAGGEGGTLEVNVSVDADAGAPTCPPRLSIAELDYDQPGSDEGEFVEIHNASSCAASLHGLTLELVNGGDQKVYGRYPLDKAGPALDADGRLLVGDPGVRARLATGTPFLALGGEGLQNGPDAVRLVRDDGSIVDAVAYEGPVPDASEGDALAADEGEDAWSRCPDGFDSNDNAADFALTSPTPGEPNDCS